MRVVANGIALEVDDRGDAGADAVLLIMGLGMPLLAWPDELVQALVARGHRVIRFDNRDIGLSQHLDHLGRPRLARALLQHALHRPVHAPYGLTDMAADTVGLLDALGLRAVHVCGASMGGMIAQHLAVHHPPRVKSLTLMMTSSGARHLPRPRARVLRAMLARPLGRNREAAIRFYQRLLRAIGSPAWQDDPARVRERIAAMVDRSYHPAGSLRQLLAIAADGDRSPRLGAIRAPTHIIHGDADPLLRVAAAHDLHARIPGSTLDIVPGMGHDLPLPLVERLADGIEQAVRRAA